MKNRIFRPARSGSRQTGAAAIEFALVLPVLLFLIYGVVVYGYLFIVQSSMTFAAQEAAQSAVAVEPLDNPTYDTMVRQRSQQTAAQVLSWLPTAQRDAIVGDSTGSSVTVTPLIINQQPYVQVQLTYDIAANNFFIPAFNLGGLQIPPLPDRLVGASSAIL